MRVRPAILMAGLFLAWAGAPTAARPVQREAGARATQPPTTASTKTVSRGFAVAHDVSIRLYLPAGTLRVETWERDSVHLAGTLAENASVFGGGARTHVKLGVEARDMQNGTLPRATLVARVPRGARLWVKMIDGELDVRGTQAELEAYLVRGRAVVRDVAGSTTVESIDAPVTLTNASGNVRVRGSRASVLLDRVTATVSVSTVSGPVTVRASWLDGRIETVGGTITAGTVRRGAHLVLQTHAGDVLLELPAKQVPALTLFSHGGVVQPPSKQGLAVNGTIDARSFKGNVRVRTTPDTK